MPNKNKTDEYICEIQNENLWNTKLSKNKLSKNKLEMK